MFQAAGCPQQYLRLQADLANYPVDTAMDNASEENMKRLELVGDDLAKQNDASLTEFVKLLCGGVNGAAGPARKPRARARTR
jgi:hypothetical protein